jgi:hypothetical protein
MTNFKHGALGITQDDAQEIAQHGAQEITQDDAQEIAQHGSQEIAHEFVTEWPMRRPTVVHGGNFVSLR